MAVPQPESVDIPTDGVLRIGADGIGEAYLPTKTVQSHAANLAFLPNGDLGCVWFGGTQEGVSDIDVWFSRRHDDLESAWSEPVRLSSDPERSEQNPVLFVAPDNTVWLLWTAQYAGNQETAVVRYRTSTDGGTTWGDTNDLLTKQGEGVYVRQQPVVLEDGRWVIPTFICTPVAGEPWVGQYDSSSVWVSGDSGQSWVEHPVPGSVGAVHMNLVAPAATDGEGGQWTAYFRSRWADHIYRSTSADAVSWQRPAATVLPNNNSSIQAIRLADGRVAVAFNESSRLNASGRRVSLYDEVDDDGLIEGVVAEVVEVNQDVGGVSAASDDADDDAHTAFWGAPRAPLVVTTSTSDGLTWQDGLVLATGDGYALSNNSRDGVNRELSYPSIVQGPDGTVHIAFTYFRKTIKYLRVPLDALDSVS